MITFFKTKTKSTKQKLEEKYNKLLSEVHKFSTSQSALTDRRFDQKLAEAQEVFRKLSQL